MTTKREMTMSAGEGPSGGGVNPMTETRVLDWILSGSDKGPSSGKEGRAGEGAAKWARRLPHIYEHKCLATMKRGRGSGEGVEELISDSGNDHNGGEESFSESHCLFTCSIDGARASLSLSLIKLVPMMMSFMLVMILYQVLI
jgi:hypothetical protein